MQATTTTSKLIAAALATMMTSVTVLGFAQNSSAPSPELRAQHMAQRADRLTTSPAEQQAEHQQRHAERQATLKATLGITAEQEPAWNAFVARTAPQARMERRADREDWAKLTTPERLDKMQARQNERAASMIHRIDATRSFYSALTPEQQQQFDTHAQTHFQRAGMQGKHRHGGHDPMAPRS
jgi:protein CpxP